MSEPFVAEIRIFGFNFAPRGWAFCDGQLLPIAQNTALFSLLGTSYGGNGETTFGLPNLQGAAPVHHGQGPGLTDRVIGEAGGSPAMTLTVNEIPLHQHGLGLAAPLGTTAVPSASVTLARSRGINLYQSSTQNLVPMSPQSVAPAGDGLPHDNMQPYLSLNFCIAMEGIFPSRP